MNERSDVLHCYVVLPERSLLVPLLTNVDHNLKLRAIKLIVVDNHPMVREGLALILDNQPDMKVVAHGNDGYEAITLYRLHKPDVAILDLSMPNMNGADAAAAILVSEPSAKILILTTFDGDQDIQRSMQAGARGYVLKDSPREDVLHAIRSLHRGQRYLSPSVGGKLADAFGAQPLTSRERSVLVLLAQGKANKEIAFDLGVTEGTIKTHVNSVRHKLGVSSRTEAALSAVRSGLIGGH